MTLEAALNTSISFVISGPNSGALTDLVLYLNGNTTAITPTALQIGTTNAWKITFTPTSTGVYSVYAFNAVQLQVQCNLKSMQTYLANIEDEALGSWTWDKTTGVLTVLRQSGATLATHTIVDNSSTASRERVS